MSIFSFCRQSTVKVIRERPHFWVTMWSVYLPPVGRLLLEAPLTLIRLQNSPRTFSMVWSLILLTLLTRSVLTKDSLQVVRDFVGDLGWDSLCLATVYVWSTSWSGSWSWHIAFNFFSCLFKSCLHFFKSLVVVVSAHRDHLISVLCLFKRVHWSIPFVLKLYLPWIEHSTLAT